jgi:hypothetical protein
MCINNNICPIKYNFPKACLLLIRSSAVPRRAQADEYNRMEIK